MARDSYDWTDCGRPSMAVIEAVADAIDRDQLDLPLLEESIDTDALDTILTDGRGRAGSRVKVSFRYAGCEVLLDSDGPVVVMNDSNAVE